MRDDILVLNSNFYPLNVSGWQDAMIKIHAGNAYPLDITFEEDNGVIDTTKISGFEVIKDFEVWKNLPIRSYDNYINTPHKRIRTPLIMICANYDQIPVKRALFPTQENIYKRDNYTCGYTGKKLTREELSIDHILPVSRGGQNTWENLITCERELNRIKSNKTPREAGLKLLWAPVKPKNGMVFDFMKKEWEIFVGGGCFDMA